MKPVVIIFTLVFFTFLRVNSQEDATSFYFSEPQPASVKNSTQIIGEITGEYLRDENQNVKLFVSRDSVFCTYPVIMSLSVAEIEAEGKYHIKDDKIYGIYKDQGLPLRIFNDTAVFVHYQHELIFAPGKDQIMKEVNGVFYLNYKESNGMWSTMALSNRGDYLYLHSLDHTLVMSQINQFDNLKEDEVKGVKTYLAAPSKDQMIAFYESKGFKDKIKYIRKNAD